MAAENRRLKIVIAGEGGQGVQAIGELLAEAAYRSGQQALYIPNFGVEQRGGVSIAFVQISTEKIGFPKFQKADLLAVLSPRSVERTKGYLKPGTIYLYDESAIKAPEIDDRTIGIQGWETIAPEAFAKMEGTEEGAGVRPPSGQGLIRRGVPAAQLAKAELNPRVSNVIIFGAIVSLIEVLPLEHVKAALEEKFAEKFRQRPELRELNYKALEMGLEAGRKPAANHG
ncbi:MAG: pyruvate oxidoreductase subunit gamma [Firmicutes bacterium]|nr:pyruvate oxidoreductase subunit gamma [Bacillota bacterium]